MSLIFSSCCANEPLLFGVQKAHARKTTRAKAITPMKIDPFFPKGNTCHQVFLSFIAVVSSKQNAKLPPMITQRFLRAVRIRMLAAAGKIVMVRAKFMGEVTLSALPTRREGKAGN